MRGGCVSTWLGAVPTWLSGAMGDGAPLLPQPRQRALEAPQGEGEPLGMQGRQHRCVTRAGSQGRLQVVDDGVCSGYV